MRYTNMLNMDSNELINIYIYYIYLCIYIKKINIELSNQDELCVQFKIINFKLYRYLQKYRLVFICIYIYGCTRIVTFTNSYFFVWSLIYEKFVIDRIGNCKVQSPLLVLLPLFEDYFLLLIKILLNTMSSGMSSLYILFIFIIVNVQGKLHVWKGFK